MTLQFAISYAFLYRVLVSFDVNENVNIDEGIAEEDGTVMEEEAEANVSILELKQIFSKLKCTFL